MHHDSRYVVMEVKVTGALREPKSTTKIGTSSCPSKNKQGEKQRKCLFVPMRLSPNSVGDRSSSEVSKL